MTVLMTLLTPLPGEEGLTFAVVADDKSASYVFADGTDDDGEGLGPDRITRLAEWAEVKPTNAQEWLALALQNLGNPVIGSVEELQSLDSAIDRAEELIQLQPPSQANTTGAPGLVQDGSPEPLTRRDVLAAQSEAYYIWSTQYPEAAAGDVDDPEAELALLHLMTPPVDPELPHSWLPIATTETECGFCEQTAEAAIHTAGADTITRGDN